MITNSGLFVCYVVIDSDSKCKIGKTNDTSKSTNINLVEALSNTSFSTILLYTPVNLYVFIY